MTQREEVVGGMSLGRFTYQSTIICKGSVVLGEVFVSLCYCVQGTRRTCTHLYVGECLLVLELIKNKNKNLIRIHCIHCFDNHTHAHVCMCVCV